jgi:hypothetical protein
MWVQDHTPISGARSPAGTNNETLAITTGDDRSKRPQRDGVELLIDKNIQCMAGR